MFVILRTTNNIKLYIMKIKILGPGCAKCEALEKSVKEAVKELNIIADIEKVNDIIQIMNYGVINVPALVINEKVIFSGKVPSVKELKEIIISQ